MQRARPGGDAATATVNNGRRLDADLGCDPTSPSRCGRADLSRWRQGIRIPLGVLTWCSRQASAEVARGDAG